MFKFFLILSVLCCVHGVKWDAIVSHYFENPNNFQTEGMYYIKKLFDCSFMLLFDLISSTIEQTDSARHKHKFKARSKAYESRF